MPKRAGNAKVTIQGIATCMHILILRDLKHGKFELYRLSYW